MKAACSRRHWVAGAAALTAVLGSAPTALCAQTRTELRSVEPFRTLSWQAAGELVVEQTGREQVSVEAEPALLSRIVTEVRGAQLTIRFAPGSIETRHPIRIRVELKSLDALEARGSGSLRIGALATPRLSLRLSGSDTLHVTRLVANELEARLDGSGEMTIGGGRVDQQQVVITGAADYSAARLASRAARVSIEGAGTVQVATSGRLDARIDGSGEVLYLGQPRVVQSVGGSGAVRRLGVVPAGTDEKP